MFLPPVCGSRLCCLALLLLFAGLFLAGCGEGGDTKMMMSNGTAQFVVDWPDRTRVLPKAAESVKVVLSGQVRSLAPQVANRPTDDAASSESLTFTHLAAGQYRYTMTAYAAANAGGAALGTATGTLTITEYHTSQVTVSAVMQSAISTLDVTADGSTTLPIGQTRQLTVTATDADGNVLLLWPGQITWSASNEGTATVDAAGLVTPHVMGTVTITATDSESGRQDTLALAVSSQTMANPIDGAEMVWVPAATFTMGYGTPAAHQVTLSSGYWIYKHEVTVAQYRAFCTATGHALPTWNFNFPDISGWDDPSFQQYPMNAISWDDARAYAAWAGVALPTEAQWEYAACGPQHNNYPWGGTLTDSDPTNGWDPAKCTLSGLMPVGSSPAGMSWCGALDLSGNVWEWCADWFELYGTAPVTDPTGPATGEIHTLKSGSTDTNELYYRCSSRVFGPPGDGASTVGFRCAAPPAP